MKVSKVHFPANVPKRWSIVLTLLAHYIPYCWLWPFIEGNWAWIQLWPLLPGLAICALIPSVPGGPDFPLLVTVLLLGISLLGVLKLRKSFWPMIAGLFVLSCALSRIIYLLMKA